MPAAAPQTMSLPKVIDLDVMDDVREWLVEATAHGDVELRANEIERCATNALLMLATAARTAANNGFSFKIKNPSDAFDEAIVRLGLDQAFSDILEGH